MSAEFDFEPVKGLPAPLPAGEEIQWQGRPDWRALARNAFHVRKVAVYFGVIVLWRLAEAAAEGLRGASLLAESAWPLAFGIVAIGLLLLLAWLNARATIYTITNRRVVLRFGVAVQIALNIPLQMVEAAALGKSDRRTGSIPIKLVNGARISYLVAWPHVRPWRLSNPEPMLRDVEHADDVARILADCWAGATGKQAASERRPALSTQYDGHHAGVASAA